MPQVTDEQVKTLVTDLATALVGSSEGVEVEQFDEEGEVVFELTVPEEAMGKVIGKSGRTAKALRSVLDAIGEVQNKRYVLDIVE
ncbi:MAG TPA: KH domain-containing protein [Terriglobales bacterium]|nr:KH domain-containing protein [Terriglobales bacterium]